MHLTIEIVAGARAGQRLEFDGRDVVRFGRHPSNDVVFDADVDRDASGKHCELRLEGGAWVLVDLKSANGTRVDGRDLSGGRRVLPSGAEFECGRGGPRVRVLYAADEHAVPPTLAQAGAAPARTGAAKIGPRTVAMMIEDALRRSGGGRRVWVIAGVASLVAATAAAGAVFVIRGHGGNDAALRREMVKIMDQQRSAADAERAELQKRLDEMAGKLRGGARGADVARANHDAVYLVVLQNKLTEDGFCTAFAIARDRLVTNAHCVYLAEDYKKRGGQISVVQNGHADTRFAVTRMRRIVGFNPAGGISPDVGVLTVNGNLPAQVTLAKAAEYQGVASGDIMYTYGFPGRLADATAPEATFIEGVVGRVTALDGRAVDLSQAQLIQHSAFSSGGTSGSPIFDAGGHVIAVNTGGYAESADAAGKATRALPGYNFGMRVDLVEQLLAEGD